MSDVTDLRSRGGLRGITPETRAAWQANDRRLARRRNVIRIVFSILAIAICWLVLR